MICFIDEKKNFIFFHEDPVPVLWDVLEVVDDADKKLIRPHCVAAAATQPVVHRANITESNSQFQSKKINK